MVAHKNASALNKPRAPLHMPTQGSDKCSHDQSRSSASSLVPLPPHHVSQWSPR